MNQIVIHRNAFDLNKFLTIGHKFASFLCGCPPDFSCSMSFPVVEDDIVVTDTALLENVGDAVQIPDDPLERLEAGLKLFCHYSVFFDFGLLVCADGVEIAVPDLDEYEEDRRRGPRRSKAWLRRVERTVCDESFSYGYQFCLEGKGLVIDSVLMCDQISEGRVEVIEDAGLVERPMRRFLRCLTK